MREVRRCVSMKPLSQKEIFLMTHLFIHEFFSEYSENLHREGDPESEKHIGKSCYCGVYEDMREEGSHELT